MNYNEFQELFKDLCLAFDLDIDRKKDRMDTYFDSKLGNFTSFALAELIKKAKEGLEVKTGSLPSIRQLLNLYYESSDRPARSPLEDRENYNQSKCVICDGTGMVSLQRTENGRKYIYDGYCCTCRRGEEREHKTTVGQRLGPYVNWLNKGFQMIDHIPANGNMSPGVPF